MSDHTHSFEALARRRATGHRRSTALLAVLTTVLAPAVVALSVSPAVAASVMSATFSGGSGTFTAATGAVYAKQGAGLSLTVTTDAATQCLEVINGSNVVIATVGLTKGNQSTWVLSDTTRYPWLVAGGGNGVVQYTTKAWKNYNAAQDKCTAGQGETFGIQSASYTLDNTAPTVSGALSPAPNGAGWNRADVTVTWTGTDTGGSGVRSVTPAADSVTADGTVTRTAVATDNVGNSATGAPVTVNLDTTAPTISGSRTPAPNANGWNNTDVTVSFSASDATSGIRTSSGPTTLSAGGANQSVTGTAVDNADNTSSTTVGGIGIDKVAPTLRGVPTTSPNAAGWYAGDVTVGWTALDALSGATSPGDSTIGGEGTGLTASATVTDRAGNATNATSAPAVRIDRTPPVTSVSAPPAWTSGDVTLALTAHDTLSGVGQTRYQLDGGGTTVGDSVPVTAEGNHTLTFWSSDVAGNAETPHSVSFGIDRTSPTIGHTQDPAPNADGWNNSPVTLTFSCSDALSGVAQCSAPRTVGTEGRAQAVTGTVRDNAGNTTSDPAEVSIDLTVPVITVDALPAPNDHGWYDDDVTATFTASDALSGVRTQDRAHTFGEGAGQRATASATDAAGNTDSVTTPVVNVDKSAPTLGGRVVGTPNNNGWFDRDVSVHWTCADELSGVVDCPEDSDVAGEGEDLSASASLSDRAGNTATATVAGIRIDRTAPVTSANGVPGGWVNAPVTVGLHATDPLSDVDSTHYSVDGATPAQGTTVTLGDEGAHEVTYWSVDNAGNREEARSFTVRLDLSSPSITPSQSPDQNAHGWNNTDVAVGFACLDQTGLSGLRDCTSPVVVTTEGRAQQVTGTATDHAGNRVTGTATVNIDRTPPSITGAPDRAANAAGWYRDDVRVSFDARDALSGIDTVTGAQRLGEGADQRVEGVATDAAGNTAGTTVDGINIDETAPNLSAAPTETPNHHGWYRTDVTEVWAADDALSGLAGDRPRPTVLSTEGVGQTVSSTVHDLAGNATSATSEPVRIDKTAPGTAVSAPGGWVNGGVDVTLTAYDALSGVDATYFSVDGGPVRSGTRVPLDDEGTHTIAFHSVDRAGNVEEDRSVTVRIDRSAPTIAHTLSPPANGNGWNNSDVTVTFSCEDQAGLSGLAGCTPPQSVTTEGAGQVVAGTATDGAGNSADDRATVSLDRTRPSITGSRSPAANPHGWNNTEVTVHFDATDELSGLDTVTADTTVGEGTDQSRDGEAVDAAGNSAHATVGGINVDRTAPTLAGAPSAPAGDDGWYRGDVTIHWTADDDRSGLLGTPGDSVLTGEGVGLRAAATVSDRAGNSRSADSAPVNIDRTAPTTGADAPGGWNGTAVTISLDPADGLSGVDATYHAVDGADAARGTTVTLDTEGVHTLRYWSVDRAGNVEPPHSVTVRIDLTRPTIGHTVVPAPNARGWNNAPVTVSYACADELSGVRSCSPDVTVSTDGQDQAVPGSAVDHAGNGATDDARVSIDTVDPTITGGPDRASNTHGWYAGDVTVGYACDDALSGIARCPAPDLLGEGEAQAAEGVATDAAGNLAHLVVGPLNVDETAPTLSGDATGQPNEAGWYRDDVTIHWVGADALSGLDGPAPGDSTVDGEGTGLTVGASVRDLAGNETSARSTPVRIDRTAPSTAASDVSDWSNGAVTVRLTAGDNLSGVGATRYQLDGGPADVGERVTIDTEGVHTLVFWSVDVAGNVEARQHVEVRIDRTAPGIGHAQSPAANGRGWNNGDVTVTFSCTDGGSGVASCTTPQTATAEGLNQTVEGRAVDHAGNSATDRATVSIDRSRPTVTGSLSATPNGNGWFDADVTATFTCADQAGLSGVLSCPAPRTLGEGRGQSAGGTATDAADNDSEPFSITGIDVDETDPSLSGAATTAPNARGWYRGDVTVSWSATDALSGIDGADPGDSTVTGEGANLAATAAVSDRAGNVTGASVGGLSIDRHAPITTASAPGGWQSQDVTVRLDASDNLSGVASTRYTVDDGAPQDGTRLTIATEGVHRVTYWSVDDAGNVETPATVTVLVDKSAPTITGRATTAPNAAGWYDAGVTVQFDCADTVSGIASCQPNVTLGAQGVNSVTGTAVDNAGNRATTTVGGIRIDTTRPSVTIGGVQDGATYTLGAVPAATASATDEISGVVGTPSVTRSGGTPNGVGTYTVTATASDRAGNTGTATATYRVVYGYGATLFLQPVNDTAHQAGLATSVFNAGQTIPMKFQLRNAAGQVVQAGTAPRWLNPVKGSVSTAGVNESAYTAAETPGGTYAWDGTQYQYNWRTDKTQAGSYWRVGVTLDDGQSYYVNVGLR